MSILSCVGGARDNVARLNDKVWTVWEYVTPQLAAEYRQKNRRNRRFMERLEANYRRQMAGGVWMTSHEGIAFDEDDTLVDGQHRLGAVENSGVPQWLLVTRGLPRGVIEVINRGRVRTLAHNLQILGYEAATPRTVAVARAMYAGVDAVLYQTQPDDVTMRRFIDQHLAAILFAQQAMSRRHGPAAVAAAVARAFYHGETERLMRFQEAMHDRLPRDEQLPGDRSARALQKAVEKCVSLGGSARLSLYKKAQNAIMAYLEGRDLENLKEAGVDLFPLPDDADQQTAGGGDAAGA